MRRLVIFALVLLAACGRPLTQSETAYLGALAGPSLDTARMRLVDGHLAASLRYTVPVRPRTTCQERIWPPIRQGREMTLSPAATVVFNTIMLREDLYRADLMAGFPDRIDLFQAMLLAHEAVHVWQWQNRAQTGYHPLKALREHTGGGDPYLFDAQAVPRFLDFGYEQQGAIVEEYVCCRLLDPDAPRTARLRALVGQVLPVEGLDAVIARPRVVLPWAGAGTEGICRPDHGG